MMRVLGPPGGGLMGSDNDVNVGKTLANSGLNSAKQLLFL